MLLCPVWALAAGDGERKAFVDAEEALRSGDRAAFQRQLAKLRSYPLYPYLIRDELLSRLGGAARAEIDAFLKAYRSEPVVTLLRAEWLKNRAAARDWDTYLASYREDLGARFDCWEAEAAYRTGAQSKGLERAAQLWDHGRSRPQACDRIFALLVASGGVTESMAWRRIERAMSLGQLRLTRYLRRFLPVAEHPIVARWISAYKNPDEVLRGAAIPPQWPRADTIVLQSLRRWARYDSPAAAAALDRLRSRYRLAGPELAELERYIALSLAQRGHEDALSRLDALPAGQQTRDVREWRARVFLRNGDWGGLAATIRAMPAELSRNLRWRYWLGRALNELDQPDAAQALLREVAEERDYYGFLAAKSLDQPYRLRPQPLEVDKDNLATVTANHGVLRAREFVSLGRPPEARVEWHRALEDAGPEDLRAAAWLASSWSWHSEAIATVARVPDWNDLKLRFPLPHQSEVSKAAQEERLEAEWIYAITRRESMFREDARSPAGALGLMQLLPTTAKLVAARTDPTLKSRSRLLDPAVNIRLGSRYLRLNRDRFDNNALVATAAYNAGPFRVEKWLPAQAAVAADVWVETIPFTETRRYVQRVLEYSVVYAHRLRSERDFFARHTVPVAASPTPP